MPFTIDRFEDNDLVVLETDDGASMNVPRAHVAPEAREGDVLMELPENELDGEVRYAVDFELTEQRKRDTDRLRAHPHAPRGRRPRAVKLLFTLLLLLLSGCSGNAQQGSLELHFIDVGQGDSVLIQGASGQNVLIDGGRKDEEVLEYLQSIGVTKLDLVS